MNVYVDYNIMIDRRMVPKQAFVPDVPSDEDNEAETHAYVKTKIAELERTQERNIKIMSWTEQT